MARKRTVSFNLLTKVGSGTASVRCRKKEVIFSQGDAGEAVFYIQAGKVTLTVVLQRGKEAVVAILDRHGLPLSVSTHAANHHEVTLVQLSVNFCMLEAKPDHLIGDRAYDSDGLDDDLKQDGVNMIAPHRSTRKLKTQDGRHLRRYQRRWRGERFFAWLQWKRRLLIRWEYYATNFLGFLQLASITMLLKQS
jgi:transposase